MFLNSRLLQFSVIFLFAGLELFASGLDLTLTYGTRYVGMGGQQVGVVEDAYSPFYNPAGLMGLENGGFALNSANLLMQYEAPLEGDNQQRKSEILWGPLFYIGGGYRLTDRVVVGLGIYPTALQGGTFKDVSYGDNIGDNDLGNRLARIEFAPSVAVKLIDYVSLGLSFRAGYTRFKNVGGVFGNVPIYESTTVSNWDAKGLKIGAKLHPFHGFSAALTYRFKMSTTLKGNSFRQTDTTALAGSVSETDTPTRIKVTIPAQLQAGLAYEFIPDTALVAFSYELTQNDVINSIDVVNRNNDQVVSSLPLNYKNGHTFHLGGEYTFHLSSESRIRSQLGFVLDRAVTQEDYPAPAIPPPNDYYGYAIGAQYEWGPHIFGLAANYGQYSKTATNVQSNAAVREQIPGASMVFNGKYGLKVLYLVADYQFYF